MAAIAAAVVTVALAGLTAPPTSVGANAEPEPGTAQDVARATELLVEFLRVPPGDLEVTRTTLSEREGQYPRRVRFQECRVPAPDGGTERLTAEVDAETWYVRYAGWLDRDPGDEPPPGVEAATREQVRRVARGFARQRFPGWSPRMRLEEVTTPRGDDAPTEYALWWRERMQGWRTATFVRVSVTGWRPPQVLYYGARVAPPHSPDEVTVARERAVSIGAWIAERVAKEPVSPFRIEGWLSHPIVPGRSPTWEIYFETKRQLDGKPAARLCVLIDAITGADVTWASSSEGPPPDWPKPEDMPPELRPRPQPPEAPE